MIRKERDGVHWLEFEIFSHLPIKHAVFLRHGGYSAGPYESLNLCNRISEDNPQHISKNILKAAGILGLEHVAWNDQVHGTNIHEVNPESAHDPRQGDAMTTNNLGLGLMVHHADCQAAIFFDPTRHALANVHCGWRGSVQNIYAKVIQYMYEMYKSRPQNILVGISPSLGPDNAQFINYRSELPQSFWEYQVKPNYFDFWAISRKQLTDCGIRPENIEIASICTFGNPQDYFSYRYQKASGRHGTIAALT